MKQIKDMNHQELKEQFIQQVIIDNEKYVMNVYGDKHPAVKDAVKLMAFCVASSLDNSDCEDFEFKVIPCQVKREQVNENNNPILEYPVTICGKSIEEIQEANLADGSLHELYCSMEPK